MSELGMDLTLMAGGIAGLAITAIAIFRDLAAAQRRVIPTQTAPAELVSSAT